MRWNCRPSRSYRGRSPPHDAPPVHLMSRRWDRARQQAGFTLLEVVVALVVLGMVVVGLAQGLRFGLLAWDRQAVAMNRDGNLDAASRTLRRLIAAMDPAPDARGSAILGTSDRLAFTAELPVGDPAFPTRLADLKLGVNAAHRLVLCWVPHLHARAMATLPASEITLLESVASVTIAYYTATAGHPPGWIDRWDDIDPPLLVRLHIVFVDATLRWPDLIIAPMRRRDDG
ncbi:MAG: prepilin-type N-terminal cleavage/methylation domain-containing protein [Janthinobacterium lividum]